jgi:26S proteasome regulatory subunit T4
VIELPLTNPELFTRVGIKPPKGVLLYGPPGTGKTLLARALASNIQATFLKVVASAIVDKYIGESARVVSHASFASWPGVPFRQWLWRTSHPSSTLQVREMFGYAKDHQPCVIFMDEIDAIGGSRWVAILAAGAVVPSDLPSRYLDSARVLRRIEKSSVPSWSS